MAERKRPLWLAPLTYLVLFAALWYSCQRPSETPQPKQISYSEFLSEVRKRHVAEVRIDEQLFIATLKTDAGKKEAAQQISAQRLPGIDETPLLKDLEAQNVTFSGHITRSSWWSQWLPLVIPVVLFMLIIGYGNRKLAQKPGPLTFGRSQAKIHDQSSEITVRFKDVAGVDEAKAELVEVVDFLRFPFMSEERNYSDKTSEAIDEEVRRISDGLYLRARTILTSRRAELERIARELILKETLDRAQIELLLLAPLIETPA